MCFRPIIRFVLQRLLHLKFTTCYSPYTAYSNPNHFKFISFNNSCRASACNACRARCYGKTSRLSVRLYVRLPKASLYLSLSEQMDISPQSFDCLVVHHLPAGRRVSRYLNLLSGQKISILPLAGKVWIGSNNGWHLLGWARRALPPCKVWGNRTTRAGCRCENVVFVCLFFYWQDCREAANCRY